MSLLSAKTSLEMYAVQMSLGTLPCSTPNLTEGELLDWAERLGLPRAESIRTGFMLAQGGEFAFVLLSLAKELKVLPDELNRLLIIVVVLSMALTPALAEFGSYMADQATEADAKSGELISRAVHVWVGHQASSFQI